VILLDPPKAAGRSGDYLSGLTAISRRSFCFGANAMQTDASATHQGTTSFINIFC